MLDWTQCGSKDNWLRERQFASSAARPGVATSHNRAGAWPDGLHASGTLNHAYRYRIFSPGLTRGRQDGVKCDARSHQQAVGDDIVHGLGSKIVQLGLPLLIAILACATIADDSDLDARVKQWIVDLGHKKFAVRQTAHEHLAEVGKPAFTQLEKIARSGSTEQRYRARAIIRYVNWHTLYTGFLEVSQQEDDKMDLDKAMWLMSLLVDPKVERAPLQRQLDKIAQDVRVRLGKQVDPAKAEPRIVVDALIAVLKDKYKLAGAQTNYDHPDNSSLDRVLSSKKGLPILLSHIAVSVADRLQVPIVGIPMPGRYMIKYDGARAPEGFSADDIIINPFDDWQILSQDGVRAIIPGFDPATHLVPSTRRATIDRMLRNLASDFAVLQQSDRATQAMKLLELF